MQGRFFLEDEDELDEKDVRGWLDLVTKHLKKIEHHRAEKVLSQG